MIYQITSDDNLSRFDIHFSEDRDKEIEEKMELGLRLTEKGNKLQKYL